MPIALKLQFTCLCLLKHASKCVLWITYCNLSLTHCFCLKFESQIEKSLPCKCHFSKKAALCTELYRKQPTGALYCFLEKTEHGKNKMPYKQCILWEAKQLFRLQQFVWKL